MTKTDILCMGLRFSGALWARAASRRIVKGRNLIIIAYHRVVDSLPEDFPFDRDVVSCTTEEFDREMAFVSKYYDVVTFNDIEKNGIDAYRNPLIVTFDDGYKDNHDVAMPVLKKHGIPATFFISTGYVEGERIPWWDEVSYQVSRVKGEQVSIPSCSNKTFSLRTQLEKDSAISALLRFIKVSSDDRRLAILDDLAAVVGPVPGHINKELFLNWNDVRNLHNNGMEIGSHTVTHLVLSYINDLNVLEHEMVESKRQLEEAINADVDTISYPVGSRTAVTEDVITIVRKAGYKYGCLYQHGVNMRMVFDPWNIKRISAEVGGDFLRFRAKVLFPGLVKY